MGVGGRWCFAMGGRLFGNNGDCGNVEFLGNSGDRGFATVRMRRARDLVNFD